jgi:hypothetical protein
MRHDGSETEVVGSRNNFTGSIHYHEAFDIIIMNLSHEFLHHLLCKFGISIAEQNNLERMTCTGIAQPHGLTD